MKDVLELDLQLFLRTLIPPGNQVMTEMEKYAEEHHVSIVQPEVGQLLNLLVHMQKPRTILEVGTGIGYSTIWMAQGLKDPTSKITTIELLAQRQQVAIENFQRAGVLNQIEAINGDAKDILPKLTNSYDLIFLDAAKGQYKEFLNLAHRLLNPNGLLICDNVLLNGWVIDLKYPERRKKTMVHRMRSFLEELKNESDFVSSIIPLGDGVALIYKKG